MLLKPVMINHLITVADEYSSLLLQGQVVDSILEAFLVFSKHQDLEIGVRALHGIGCLCLRKPQLLASPKVKAVIDMALIDASSYRRKEAILRVLADMLEGEDAKARQSSKPLLILCPFLCI